MREENRFKGKDMDEGDFFPDQLFPQYPSGLPFCPKIGVLAPQRDFPELYLRIVLELLGKRVPRGYGENPETSVGGCMEERSTEVVEKPTGIGEIEDGARALHGIGKSKEVRGERKK
jgi:hypothetical protein